MLKKVKKFGIFLSLMSSISYIDLYLPKYERQGKLLETKSFWCMCLRCSSNSLSDQFIDGIGCLNDCSNGFILLTSENERKCTVCFKKYTDEEYMQMQQMMESDYDAAYDFIKIGGYLLCKTLTF